MIYIISKDGKLLMPSRRWRHIKKLIKEGKATKISSYPFVVQLNYDTPNITQPLTLGIDPGRDNIGVSVITDTGKEVYSAHLSTRNRDIPKLMQDRKAHRNKHRNYGRRKKKIRRAIKNKTTTKKPCKKTKKINSTTEISVLERVLPGCEEPIKCIGIKNKEARFNNRKRKDGWLTPTANQLLNTHLNFINKIRKILPITNVVVELNKFSFIAMDNPNIKKWEYSKGPLSGFNGLEDAVSCQQDCHCLLCNEPIDCYHHVVPRNKNGSNTIPNIVGLCKEHHDLVHKDEKVKAQVEKIKQGMNKRYGALSILNQIIPYLIEKLSEILPTTITDGYSTKAFRTNYDIKKTHENDAYCIACSTIEHPNVDMLLPEEKFELKQFRRQDRQACHKENVNRRYYLNGKLIAINRHKATEQTEDSLEEYVSKGGRTDNLTVKKHPPTYKQMDRIMPGALMLVDNKYYKVLQGSTGRHKTKDSSSPNYYIFTDGTKATPKHCKLIKRNEGILYIPNVLK